VDGRDAHDNYEAVRNFLRCLQRFYWGMLQSKADGAVVGRGGRLERHPG